MSTPDSAPILLCYDRSVGALRAIETAGELFPGRRAVVLHVWSPTASVGSVYGAMVPSAAFDESEIRAEAMQVAVEGVGFASHAGLAASPAIASAAFNGTANTILETAEEHEAGVIVLGARGLSAFRSMVLGSVSHAVVQHAHCPVLVVPPLKHAEADIAPVEAETAPVADPPGILLLGTHPASA
jgi:nucleotide-binding universal stress UspA family protein